MTTFNQARAIQAAEVHAAQHGHAFIYRLRLGGGIYYVTGQELSGAPPWRVVAAPVARYVSPRAFADDVARWEGEGGLAL
jgi:hypothetical protein